MLHAGSASRDITPNTHVPLAGYGFKLPTQTFHDGPREDRSTGVHDPLFANALVLSDTDTTVGIVSTDLVGVNRTITANVASAIGERDLDIDYVLLTGTHTHSGPYISAVLRDLNPVYACDHDTSETEQWIQDRLVDALLAAGDDTRPATVRVGRAENERTPVNRRVAHQDLGDTADIVDPELLVLQVETDSGDEAVLVNFACHPICASANESQVSADYPGIVRDRIHQEWGDENTTVLFLNGAAGDINPRDRNRNKGYEYMQEIGDEVSDTALDALGDLQELDHDGRITAAERDIDLPLRSVPPRAELSQRRAELTDAIQDATDEDQAIDLRYELGYVTGLLRMHDLDDTLAARVQYVRLGECGLLSLPGEAFVQHGLDFKDAAATDHLLVAGYANTPCGYLPTLDAFENEGYEIRSAKVAPEAIERLRETCFDLLSTE